MVVTLRLATPATYAVFDASSRIRSCPSRAN
jgi:hypothetical protein